MAAFLVIVAVKIQKPPSGLIRASKLTFFISFNVGPTSWVSPTRLHYYCFFWSLIENKNL